MQRCDVKVLVISISNPILIGLYKKNKLIKTLSKEGKTSDVLPLIFEDILKSYNVIEMFYANGPGSYMAIKIGYLFLKTISIINRIKLHGVSAFDLNNNSPIKALGKKYFFRIIEKDRETITMKFLENEEVNFFSLPQTIDNLKCNKNSLPEYNLPAV